MIKTIGVFLQEQLLGMRWLNQLVGNLLQAIGIDLESRMGASVQFFIYDIIKIFILLSLPSMVMLRKAVKPRLLAVFFGVVVVGIMLIGFFFNAISVAF